MNFSGVVFQCFINGSQTVIFRVQFQTFFLRDNLIYVLVMLRVTRFSNLKTGQLWVEPNFDVFSHNDRNVMSIGCVHNIHEQPIEAMRVIS